MASLSSHGYVRMKLPDGSRNYQHVLIAERILGRPLARGEVVHHIDGDKTNNANSNLLICTAKYHAELHSRLEASPNWPEFPARIKAPRGQRGSKNTKSRFKGVELKAGAWQAYASINGKKHYIGRFALEVDAARAYDSFVVERRGPNWTTNHSLGLL